MNIVSWLLTDYRMDTVDQIPELCDEEGNALKRDTRKKEGQEWGVLYKEDRRAMKRIFIDGLSGMAQGLFATLIIEQSFSRSECLLEEIMGI